MSSYSSLMKREALMERKALYEAWEQSGLTKAKFCKQNNIAKRTFFKWIKQLQNNNYIDNDDEWDNKIFNKRLQNSSDLGQRMNSAFEEILKSYDSAIIIGSDCPQIKSTIIEQAFEDLKSHDFILGPTEDGGYYMLGMKKLVPNFFDNMTWSTSSVYSETLSRIKQSNYSFAELPILSDLDNYEDLKKFPELMP